MPCIERKMGQGLHIYGNWGKSSIERKHVTNLPKLRKNVSKSCFIDRKIGGKPCMNKKKRASSG
jgi:hypothetical protein